MTSFSVSSNPNGNWSYGFTPKEDLSNFSLFQHADRHNHFATPEAPTDMWRREDEWHPLILRNTSDLNLVIQEVVILHPTMLELHPGRNGERSVLRWTVPADGFYHLQGQFRGINLNGDTSTDALVVQNAKLVLFTASVDGFNIEKPFDLTFKGASGDTIDFSVGYGSNNDYNGDSTGFSAIITTISLADKNKSEGN